MHSYQFEGGPSVINFNELAYVFRTTINNILGDENKRGVVVMHNEESGFFINTPHTPKVKEIEDAIYEVMENEFSCDNFGFTMKALPHGRLYTILLPRHIGKYLTGEQGWD